ncbi:MAG: JAB-like toxin 1 domain-containing protein [Bacteroidaceae bacterium]
MKKLTKSNLEELAKVMPVLSEEEQKEYVGGDLIYMNRAGQIMDRTIQDGADVICFEAPEGELTGARYTMPKDYRLESYSYDITDSSGTVTGQGQGVVFKKYGSSGNNMEMFETFVENTDVEWGLSNNKSNGNAALFSSHNHTELQNFYEQGTQFDSSIHSHPCVSEVEDEPYESLDDLGARERDKKRGFTDFQVYIKSEKEYVPYTKTLF